MNRLFGLQHRGGGDGDYNTWNASVEVFHVLIDYV